MSRSDRCWTCGRKRGMAAVRSSWSTNFRMVSVPRTDNPEDQPAQICNDLVAFAQVYRNGGSDEGTFVCDECLRMGLRRIKQEVDEALGELDAGHNLAQELAVCQERLARAQWARQDADHSFRCVVDLLRAVPGKVEMPEQWRESVRYWIERKERIERI